MDKTRKITGIIAVLVAVIMVSTAGFYFISISSGSGSAHSGPIKVTDSLNRTLYFNHTVTRIVSIDPAATATLYALGAYKDLVGGNAFDSYPPNDTLPSVWGNLSTAPNYQMLVNLTPQVVLVYGATMPSYGTYINNTLHIPVLVDNPESIGQIESFTTMLGTLTGTDHNASLINQWINQSIGDLQKSVASINKSSEYSMFYYLSSYGGIWTVGQNTFMNQMFQIAKLRNIINASGYPTINGEIIINESPQVILLDQYVPYSAVAVAPFNETQAYYSGKIISIFNDNFFEEPDFRVIYAIYWLISEVYPSTFPTLPPFPIALQYPPTTGFN
ncbi:MAG: ABC transporter substrate-binding protein [Thermoplasmataceae archaeon]